MGAEVQHHRHDDPAGGEVKGKSLRANDVALAWWCRFCHSKVERRSPDGPPFYYWLLNFPCAATGMEIIMSKPTKRTLPHVANLLNFIATISSSKCAKTESELEKCDSNQSFSQTSEDLDIQHQNRQKSNQEKQHQQNCKSTTSTYNITLLDMFGPNKR